jgi:glycosyltransferase involved in cell wall biosynthesis
MSCGVPVIATDCGGPKEVITPGTGLLVSPENAGELAEAILQMSMNLKSYDRASISKYASDTFGYRAFIKYISNVYNEVTDSGKPNLLH